jgi:hypothetical protein
MRHHGFLSHGQDLVKEDRDKLIVEEAVLSVISTILLDLIGSHLTKLTSLQKL